jgi:hypothetical protein
MLVHMPGLHAIVRAIRVLQPFFSLKHIDCTHGSNTEQPVCGMARTARAVQQPYRAALPHCRQGGIQLAVRRSRPPPLVPVGRPASACSCSSWSHSASCSSPVASTQMSKASVSPAGKWGTRGAAVSARPPASLPDRLPACSQSLLRGGGMSQTAAACCLMTLPAAPCLPPASLTHLAGADHAQLPR